MAARNAASRYAAQGNSCSRNAATAAASSSDDQWRTRALQDYVGPPTTRPTAVLVATTVETAHENLQDVSRCEREGSGSDRTAATGATGRSITWTTPWAAA